MANDHKLADSRQHVLKALLRFERYLMKQGEVEAFVPVGGPADWTEGYAFGFYFGKWRLVYVTQEYGIPPEYWTADGIKDIHNMTATQRMSCFAYAKPLREKVFQQLGRDAVHNTQTAGKLERAIQTWESQDAAMQCFLKSMKAAGDCVVDAKRNALDARDALSAVKRLKKGGGSK